MGHLIAILFLVSAATAQVKLESTDSQPKVVNAKLETRAATNLLATVDELTKSQQPLWIGYAVPTIAKTRFICCFDGGRSWWRERGCCTGCKLEQHNGNYFHSDGGTCVSSEPLHAGLRPRRGWSAIRLAHRRRV
jgi:hypothetical protein